MSLPARCGTRPASGGLAIVVLERAAQAFAANNVAVVLANFRAGLDDLVIEALMVAFRMVERYNTKPISPRFARSSIPGIRGMASR